MENGKAIIEAACIEAASRLVAAQVEGLCKTLPEVPSFRSHIGLLFSEALHKVRENANWTIADEA